jgi:hypothetical protein
MHIEQFQSIKRREPHPHSTVLIAVAIDTTGTVTHERLTAETTRQLVLAHRGGCSKGKSELV